MTELFLIRHAEVETEFHRVFGGRLDIALSDRGHEQAQRTAQWLKKIRFDAIYASPMKRVQLTLAPYLNAAPDSPPPVPVPDLREVDFGKWTGLRWAEVHEQFGVSAFDWLRQMDRGGFPGGESAADLRLRVGAVLDHILAAHPDQRVSIFAHGGVIRMLLSILLRVPLPCTEGLEIDYASITTVHANDHRHGRIRHEIQLLNFTPWRDL